MFELLGFVLKNRNIILAVIACLQVLEVINKKNDDKNDINT